MPHVKILLMSSRSIDKLTGVYLNFIELIYLINSIICGLPFELKMNLCKTTHNTNTDRQSNHVSHSIFSNGSLQDEITSISITICHYTFILCTRLYAKETEPMDNETLVLLYICAAVRYMNKDEYTQIISL